MTEEFCLSNKEVCVCGILIKDVCTSPKPTYFYIEDVKEFIRQLKESIYDIENCNCSDYNPQCDRCKIIEEIDKLAGDALIK